MDGHGLLHVNDDKVFISGLGSRELCRVELGWLLHQAQQGGDVRFLLCGRDVTPGFKLMLDFVSLKIHEMIRLTTLGEPSSWPWYMSLTLPTWHR